MAPTPEPWEQLDGEPANAFIAFRNWRDLGLTRTYKKLCDQMEWRYESKRQRLYEWANLYRWHERVAAYDRLQEREYLKEVEQARREMNRRQARLASAFQAHIVSRIQNIDPSTLTNSELIRWLEVATKVERQAWGGDTDRVELTGPEGGPIAVTELTAEERREWLDQAYAEINRRRQEWAPTNLDGTPEQPPEEDDQNAPSEP